MLLPRSHTFRISAEKVHIPDGCKTLFAAQATEERAQLSAWTKLAVDEPARCIAVVDQCREEITVRIGSEQKLVSLRDESNISDLLPDEQLYIDISGLSHHVWAPILKCAWNKVRNLAVVYTEPLTYKPHTSPASPTVYDLSSGFEGMAPLPGFAQLAGSLNNKHASLVAMLGFEGSRPLHLALQLDSVSKVFPIVGVPGFRIEYPAATIASNREFLDEYTAHSEIRYARASCPFEAYEALVEIHRAYPEHYLYIAPVGTKPHALGAVRFAIENPGTSELIYDHPIRKPGRTSGQGTLHIYNIKSNELKLGA